MNNISANNFLICSFYTKSDYYTSHAKRLSNQLDALKLPHRIEEYTDCSDDWAENCKYKIKYLHTVRAQNPLKKLFWIDADCELLFLPDYIRDFSADLIGFTRNFHSAPGKTYNYYSRFWVPSFFGINTTPGADLFLNDAHEFYLNCANKVTDDYIIEESWRKNAHLLSYQIIEGNTAQTGYQISGNQRRIFIQNGDSGNVSSYINSVKQHSGELKLLSPPRTQLLYLGRHVYTRLSPGKKALIKNSLSKTGLLEKLRSRHNGFKLKSIANKAIQLGKSGKIKELDDLVRKTKTRRLMREEESKAIHAAHSFSEYGHPVNDEIPILLSWYEKPYPGNFGDWLSPLIFKHYSKSSVQHSSIYSQPSKAHIFGLGSIGEYINKHSIVTGTGISQQSIKLSPKAKYISLRGPVSAQALKLSGGPEICQFGDPGVLISRIFPQTRNGLNGRILLIRHYSHSMLPITLPDNVDEISILLSSPNEIANFTKIMNSYTSVITSSLHVMITCHSYGIPCGLITFQGFEDSISGDKTKYKDYSLGVGLPEVNPYTVGLDLRERELTDLIEEHSIPSDVMDLVESNTLTAINDYRGAIKA